MVISQSQNDAVFVFSTGSVLSLQNARHITALIVFRSADRLAMHHREVLIPTPVAYHLHARYSTRI